MAALTDMAAPDHILFGTDWPFVERPFVIEQVHNLINMQHFAGDKFEVMAHGAARKLFPRFA